MLNSYAPGCEIAALFASREANRPAEVHADAEGVEHGGLYRERLEHLLFVGSVGDVHVIGAMLRGPEDLIRRLPQIPTGDENYFPQWQDCMRRWHR
jgi:hypothetical protein